MKKAEIMEVETMLDDDVFFAELSKRISLLITDDDEGADFSAAQFIPAAAAAAAPLQGFASRAHVPSQASLLAPPAYALYHHYHHGASYGGDDSARAAWQQLQCGSKGTGVFIPRSTPGSAHPKKKGKSRGAAAAAAKAARAAGAGAPPRKRV